MKEDRFISQRVQYSRIFKNGLWGIYDTKNSDYLNFGSKGKMNTACKILNEKT